MLQRQENKREGESEGEAGRAELETNKWLERPVSQLDHLADLEPHGSSPSVASCREEEGAKSCQELIRSLVSSPSPPSLSSRAMFLVDMTLNADTLDTCPKSCVAEWRSRHYQTMLRGEQEGGSQACTHLGTWAAGRAGQMSAALADLSADPSTCPPRGR